MTQEVPGTCLIRSIYIILFGGVCVTTVILAPGACEGRLRAAAFEIDSYVSAGSGGFGGSSGSGGVFQISHFRCVLQYLRARGVLPRLKIYQTAAEVPKKVLKT